jgi:hypothetical protein
MVRQWQFLLFHADPVFFNEQAGLSINRAGKSLLKVWACSPS